MTIELMLSRAPLVMTENCAILLIAAFSTFFTVTFSVSSTLQMNGESVNVHLLNNSNNNFNFDLLSTFLPLNLISITVQKWN